MLFVRRGRDERKKLTFQQHRHEWRVHENDRSDEHETVIVNGPGAVVAELEKHTADHETDERVHKQFEHQVRLKKCKRKHTSLTIFCDVRLLFLLAINTNVKKNKAS